MPMIRPSTDLRDKYEEIAEYCHMRQEPVFLAKNNTGDLVVMSQRCYDQLNDELELHRLLDEGLAAMKEGRGRLAEDVFADLEKHFGLIANV